MLPVSLSLFGFFFFFFLSTLLIEKSKKGREEHGKKIHYSFPGFVFKKKKK